MEVIKSVEIHFSSGLFGIFTYKLGEKIDDNGTVTEIKHEIIDGVCVVKIYVDGKIYKEHVNVSYVLIYWGEVMLNEWFKTNYGNCNTAWNWVS